PHLAAMEWDYADRLKHTLKSVGSRQDTHFTYDAAGQRVREVYVHNGLIEERIYLGGYEVYRRHTAGSVTAAPDEERQTLHVMDDQRRVVMVETKTRDAAGVANPVGRWRFQLDNHLGSATLELDESGDVISYEEYHPYGSTAFHTADGSADVSAKRYRYTGKEKDDETGLYYHGARYYAPWLGRWTAADPAGLSGGLNLFAYVGGNPINLQDPDGRKPRSWGERAALWLHDQIKKSPVAEGVVENLEKRGDAFLRAPGAIKELYEKEGASGVLKTVGKGAVQLVEDTADAAVDVGFYGAKAVIEGDADAAKKAASRGVDVVLGVADTVTLFEGAAALKSAGTGGAKALAGAAEDLGKGGALVTAEGVVASGKALASTAPKAAIAADAAKGTALMMSQGNNLPHEGSNAGPKPKELSAKKSATETRNSPGKAEGKPASAADELVFRGTQGSVAQVPEQLAARLRGMTFGNFDEFRQAFWKAVSADPSLAKGFGRANLARLQQGLAPIAPAAQQYGKLKSYILHHKVPIENGGGVFDLGNIEIVSPRYHQMLHGGK
ncbi:MAG: RHS repeat-associated core domain-containing protein, partial [Myxococcales bacterium]